MKTILIVDQTDELILAACTPADGATEDCEVGPTQVKYFFETGTTRTVNRISGEVTLL
jgi:hypothetical protein